MRAPALREGDRVVVLAPSSSVLDRDRLSRGIRRLASFGYDVVEGRHLRHAHGHLAAPDEARLEDLRGALRDPTVRGVFVGRGGYGVQRIVDAVDWNSFRRSPTLIVGFSDLTALLHAAWQRAGVVALHGPSASRLVSLHESSVARLASLLAGATTDPVTFGANQVVVPGVAEGRLLGGNLSLIAAGIGTPDELHLEGDVLLLEDVNEPPYAVDRMLTQLRRSGFLEGAAAVVVARWVGCDRPSDRPSATVSEVTVERLGDLGVPLVVDLPLGHAADQQAVAHGAEATLDTRAGTLAMGAAVS